MHFGYSALGASISASARPRPPQRQASSHKEGREEGKLARCRVIKVKAPAEGLPGAVPAALAVCEVTGQRGKCRNTHGEDVPHPHVLARSLARHR